jgi:indole-3-glycerol phosphate synthase
MTEGRMFLKEIIKVKKAEVQGRKNPIRQKEMETVLPSLPLPRNLVDAILGHPPIALIAEIKRASPSLGAINENVDILQLTNEYEKGGASAISVLTESYFFKGDLFDLQQVKKATSLPILQKDFVLDPYQIYEGRVWGADAILLIAAILDRAQLHDYASLAQSLGMVPLVEIHDESDLEKTSGFSFPLIGINNRDLRTFGVDLNTSLNLKRQIPSATKVISESGIRDSRDVRLLREAGIDGILVGETLMRSQDPAAKIKELLSG